MGVFISGYWVILFLIGFNNLIQKLIALHVSSLRETCIILSILPRYSLFATLIHLFSSWFLPSHIHGLCEHIKELHSRAVFGQLYRDLAAAKFWQYDQKDLQAKLIRFGHGFLERIHLLLVIVPEHYAGLDVVVSVVHCFTECHCSPAPICHL